jgi:DNA-binding NarL/FixJ family response regulator
MPATMLKTKTSPIKIMIVDDHALVRLGLAQLISHEPDMDVCGDARDADEALEKIEELRPDLVIVDISLQRGNGIELTKSLKARYPDVKVLISSMHDESLFAERALHAGALGYINKQEATDKVVEAIRHVLDGQIYLSPEMTNHLLHRLGNHRDDPLERPSLDSLSDREWEVFELIGRGRSTRQIAEQLHLSIKTIETHREHIKEKLNLTNSAELTRHAVHWVLEAG